MFKKPIVINPSKSIQINPTLNRYLTWSNKSRIDHVKTSYFQSDKLPVFILFFEFLSVNSNSTSFILDKPPVLSIHTDLLYYFSTHLDVTHIHSQNFYTGSSSSPTPTPFLPQISHNQQTTSTSCWPANWLSWTPIDRSTLA